MVSAGNGKYQGPPMSLLTGASWKGLIRYYRTTLFSVIRSEYVDEERTQGSTDGHNDLAILIRFLYKNQIYDPAFTKPFEEGGLEMHVDLPRLKAGKVGATFWSAFVLCPTNGTDFSDEAYAQRKLPTDCLLCGLYRQEPLFVQIQHFG